ISPATPMTLSSNRACNRETWLFCKRPSARLICHAKCATYWTHGDYKTKPIRYSCNVHSRNSSCYRADNPIRLEPHAQLHVCADHIVFIGLRHRIRSGAQGVCWPTDGQPHTQHFQSGSSEAVRSWNGGLRKCPHREGTGQLACCSEKGPISCAGASFYL